MNETIINCIIPSNYVVVPESLLIVPSIFIGVVFSTWLLFYMIEKTRELNEK